MRGVFSQGQDVVRIRSEASFPQVSLLSTSRDGRDVHGGGARLSLEVELQILFSNYQIKTFFKIKSANHLVEQILIVFLYETKETR